MMDLPELTRARLHLSAARILDVCPELKWSCKIGQSVKVYSNTTKEYRNDEETEVFRPV